MKWLFQSLSGWIGGVCMLILRVSKKVPKCWFFFSQHCKSVFYFGNFFFPLRNWDDLMRIFRQNFWLSRLSTFSSYYTLAVLFNSNSHWSVNKICIWISFTRRRIVYSKIVRTMKSHIAGICLIQTNKMHCANL